MTSPEPLFQIQNNNTEMFLMMPFTKVDLNVYLCWTTWPPELKTEIYLNDISLARGQYIISSCARIHVSDTGPSCFSGKLFSLPEPKAHWWANSIPVTQASVRRSSVNIFKHLLLWNYWANWTHISYGDSLGWGNESLFKCSWSHDQDGRHAHIW